MGKAGLITPRLLAAAGMLMALGGCAPDYLPVDKAGHRSALPPPNEASGSASAATPATPASGTAEPTASPPAPPAQPTAPDTCGASSLAYLIGKPKSEIPVPTDLSRRRVTCSTCAVTEDYRPDRVTIVYDQQTGLVQSVKCG